MVDKVTPRVSVPALDEILGQKWPVLDDGFVRVVDYLGSDEAIVQAARVSYGTGTRTVHEDDGLIRYLLRHEHSTPFEMCEIKLHVRVPMDTWRQWIRHRTANVNEYSTRYSIAIDSAAKTDSSQWRSQSKRNRQGSGNWLSPAVGTTLTQREVELHRMARNVYEERLGLGVAREQARKDLPLATYTEAFWKIDLHNLLRFIRLRIAPTAQHEIRCYARTIGEEIVCRWCPISWKAFEDYQLNSMVLSARDIEVIRLLEADDVDGARTAARTFGWLESKSDRLVANRERAELEDKLRELGIRAPWP